MIVLDVLLCADAPAAGPPDWPALVVERPADSPPPAPPRLRMTVAEYDAYRAARLAGWQAWRAAQPAPASPPPASVARWKARSALRQAGLLAAVQALIAEADEATQEWWAAGQELERGSPRLAVMAAALGLTEAQVDDLFRAAEAVTA